MEIKDFDYLSQKIALYFYGRRRHSSIIGGILTMMMFSVCLIYISFLIKVIFQHKSSNYISYKKYSKDAGKFQFRNNDGIFHYFKIVNIDTNTYDIYNKKYIRIFMTRYYQKYLNNSESLKNTEHWVYDICRNGIDYKNISTNIIANQNYQIEGGACLRYYYNQNSKIYYSIEDTNNFKYPDLIQYSDTSYLNSIIEKCNNNSILTKVLGYCADEKEINEYLNIYKEVNIHLLGYEIETENYTNPIVEYFNVIHDSMNLFEVPINNIYLAPFDIEIKKGTLIPKNLKKKTYILDNHSRTFWYNNSNNGIILIFNFWLINSCHVFKGGYETLYDMLGSVGGIIQLTYYLFFGLNFIFNEFFILKDSKRLFFKIRDYKEDEKESKNKIQFNQLVKYTRQQINDKNDNNAVFPIKMKQENSIINFPNQKYSNNLLQNRIFPRKKGTDTSINHRFNINKVIGYKIGAGDSSSNLQINDIFAEQININKKKIQKTKTIFNLNEYNENNKSEINNNIIDIPQNAKNKKQKVYFYNKNYKQFSDNFLKFISVKKRNIKLEALPASYLRKNTTFCHFLGSLGGKNTKFGKPFYIINKFREKLLSEEHFFRTHVFIYYLEKYFDISESDKIDITELFNYL